MNNQARTPAPSSARTSTSVRASTLTPTPTPLRTPTPVRTRTPIRTQTPVLTPSPARPPALVQTTAPAHIPTQVPTPALVRIPRLVPPPARAWIPTPVPAPAPVRNPTPVPTPAGTLTPPVRVPAPAPAPAQVLAGIRTALPALDSYPAPALPLDPPPEPAPEPPLSPEEDPEPAPSLKLIPSVSSEAGPALGPLPAHTPLAANSSGPTLDFTFRADPLATGLADPHIPSSVPAPILGTIPSALSLQNSTETFVSTSENFALDKRVLIRVTYCGLSYSLRYILLKNSLEQQFPNHLLFEEDRAAQATGEFEVFVNGRLVHSKKRGDGFVNESGLQKIVSVIYEEIKKR
uniref:Selenoprotein V n=1 Tax=Rhinopithecus roxellana TaxID=61622 RepID=A0A2K6NV70_RHIRO